MRTDRVSYWTWPCSEAKAILPESTRVETESGMTWIELTRPQVAFIAGTPGALGFGAGLFLSTNSATVTGGCLTGFCFWPVWLRRFPLRERSFERTKKRRPEVAGEQSTTLPVGEDAPCGHPPAQNWRNDRPG
jgi:hypothetical protein